MATDEDLDDTLERAAHHTLTEFCERHLSGLASTAIAMFSIQNEGNTAWSERLAAVGDPERLAYHTGWAFTERYAQHMSSMFQVVVILVPTSTYAWRSMTTRCLPRFASSRTSKRGTASFFRRTTARKCTSRS
jgi:hypothetical protein